MNSFRSGMNSFQIEIMENCGDKVWNEFIPDRNEFIPVNFFSQCYCELCMTETPVDGEGQAALLLRLPCPAAAASCRLQAGLRPGLL